MELHMNKMILAAAMIVATVASVAPASAMQTARGVLHFPPHVGPGAPQECDGGLLGAGGGTQLAKMVVSFPKPVVNAVAVLTGFDVQFSNMDDHHLGRLEVAVSVSGNPVGQSVEVCITYGLRDWSGNWDDRYEGDIFFAVLGE
jgi:hypothetical protein